LLVCDGVAEGAGGGAFVDLLDGDMDHEADRGGAVPDARVGLDDGLTATSAAADGDQDGLPDGIGVRRGPGPGVERTTAVPTCEGGWDAVIMSIHGEPAGGSPGATVLELVMFIRS
jgi:hypothetical protein